MPGPKRRHLAPSGEPKSVQASTFFLSLQCPHCGGPVEASPHDVTRTCAHCQSLLLVRGGEADVWVQKPTLSTPEDVARLVVDSAVAAFEARKRWAVDNSATVGLPEAVDAAAATVDVARLAGALFGPVGAAGVVAMSPIVFAAVLAGHFKSEEEDGENDLLQSATAFRRAVAKGTRVLNLRRVMVPFVHSHGSLVYLELGRTAEHEKRLFLTSMRLEESAPSYPTDLNFRDAGLRMGRTALARIEEAGLKGFDWIPPRSSDEAIHTTTTWRASGPTGAEALVREELRCVRWQAVVYRPYLLANVRLREKRLPILVDAGFGCIAGRPTDEEAKAIRSRSLRHRPRREERAVSVLGSRCHNCGSDVAIGPTALVVVCVNCHAGLRPTEQGLRVVPYELSIAEGVRSAAYLPFWSFSFALTWGKETFTDLDEWASAARRSGMPKTFTAKGASLLVPALSWLNTPAGDSAFVATARALHRIPVRFSKKPLPDGQVGKFAPVEMSASAASTLSKLVLASLFDRMESSRLKADVFTRLVTKVDVTLEEATLSYVGFEKTAKGVRRDGVDIPIPAHAGSKSTES